MGKRKTYKHAHKIFRRAAFGVKCEKNRSKQTSAHNKPNNRQNRDRALRYMHANQRNIANTSIKYKTNKMPVAILFANRIYLYACRCKYSVVPVHHTLRAMCVFVSFYLLIQSIKFHLFSNNCHSLCYIWENRMS